MKQRIKVIPSSGNVFADLHLKNADALHAKAELAVHIATALNDRKLTQTAASQILKIDQPKVSKLMRGELYGFSSDQLLRFLVELGRDVEIVVRKRQRRTGRGKLSVHAA